MFCILLIIGIERRYVDSCISLGVIFPYIMASYLFINLFRFKELRPLIEKVEDGLSTLYMYWELYIAKIELIVPSSYSRGRKW